MAEPPARLWLNQARSDWKAAERLLDKSEGETFCQALAKYQRVVEKSVKAIAAAVSDVGICSINIGFTHEVDRVVSALVHIPPKKGTTNIKDQIRALLNESRRGEVRALCSLAPRRPGPGELARRNTEYPFQKPDGTWIAPHEKGAFNLPDVERFRALASRIIDGSERLVSALKRYGRAPH